MFRCHGILPQLKLLPVLQIMFAELFFESVGDFEKLFFAVVYYGIDEVFAAYILIGGKRCL